MYHSRAIKIMMTEGMKRPAPRISKPAILFAIETLVSDEADGGFLKKNTSARIVSAPIGRLIQKHHLQVACSVKAPPRIGPMIVAMPNVDCRMPM